MVKKYLIHIIMAVLFSMASPVYAQVNLPKESGLTLDIARHFYSKDVIKSFLDALKDSGGDFLHLHFSDDENYAIESTILNQRAEDAIVKDDIYINPKTNKPFLSYAQLGEIIRHAKANNIEIVPEVDSPSHMQGIFTLVEFNQGREYLQSIRAKASNNEIDMTQPESRKFIKSLIEEVIWVFGNSSKHFHIGGDEFGYSVDNNHEFIDYANELAEFVESKGLTPRIWNDGLIKNNLAQLNKNIQVTYWSYDGDTQDSHEAEKRRHIRASLPDLVENGFSVLNYNSYYLYTIPKKSDATSHNYDYAMQEVQNSWHLGIWDGKNKHNAMQNTDKIIGSAISIWGEHAKTLSPSTIQKYSEGLLNSVITKTKNNKGLSAIKLNSRAYLDLAHIKEHAEITLGRTHHQILNLLEEDALMKRSALTLWISGSSQDNVQLNPNWQKSSKAKIKNGKRYTAYQYQQHTLWIDDVLSVRF